MQAEEIKEWLAELLFSYKMRFDIEDRTDTPRRDILVHIRATIAQWSSLLSAIPTTEEQQALQALRAGYSWWPHIGGKAEGYYACLHPSLAVVSPYSEGDTPMAALAAVGRMLLGEGEER